MDEVDSAIVRELQANARLSNRELAARLGIAASTCHVRTASLRERGVLAGFHAEVDLVKVGLAVQALVAFQIRPLSRQVIEGFRAFALSLPPVSQLDLRPRRLDRALPPLQRRARPPRAVQAGWFVEAVVTQVLAVHIIRTRRPPRPFRRTGNRPGRALLANTGAAVTFGLAVPFTPLGAALGMHRLPPGYYAILLPIVLGYLAVLRVGVLRYALSER